MQTAVHSNWMEQSSPRIAVLSPVGGDVFNGPIFAEEIADALVMELVHSGFSVMERTRLEQIIKEHSLQYTGSFNPASLIALDKLAGVDYIILGSLTTRRTLSVFDYFIGDGVEEIQIDSIRVRWVSVRTGQIMASCFVKNSRGGTPEKIAKKIIRGMDAEIKHLARARTNREEFQVSAR